MTDVSLASLSVALKPSFCFFKMRGCARSLARSLARAESVSYTYSPGGAVVVAHPARPPARSLAATVVASDLHVRTSVIASNKKPTYK